MSWYYGGWMRHGRHGRCVWCFVWFVLLVAAVILVSRSIDARSRADRELVKRSAEAAAASDAAVEATRPQHGPQETPREGKSMSTLKQGEPGPGPRAIAEQIRMYEAASEAINRSLAAAIERLAKADPDSREAYTAGQQQLHAAAMRREIDAVLARFGRPTPALTEAARATVDRAIADGEAQLRELGLKPTERVRGLGTGTSFAAIDRGAVEVIARDTAAKAASDMAGSMRGMLDSHGRAAGDLFRRLSLAVMADGRSPLRESATNRAIAQGLITGNPREATGMLREIFKDPAAAAPESYRQLGSKIIAVGEAEMRVRDYAALVVRTRTREAAVTARHERLTVSGISLVQITGRQSPYFCTAFIGLVCSLTGEQVIDGVRYPALSSLPGGGPPFHPNCTKGTAAFIRDLVSEGRVTAQRRAIEVFIDRERQGRLTAPVRA